MANFSIYLAMVLLATFKFMFAAVPGVIAGLPFWGIYISVTIGGLLSFNVFYFMANFFIKRTLENKLKKIKSGTYKPKKSFTKVNKKLVKLKMTTAGFWIITIAAPLVMSVPLGTIVVAKFYRHHKESYWISTTSILIFGAVFTYLIQLIKS